jgi:hypothetical protein
MAKINYNAKKVTIKLTFATKEKKCTNKSQIIIRTIMQNTTMATEFDFFLENYVQENKDINIPLHIKEFKTQAKDMFINLNLQKLSHAKENLAKKLGYSCYRAYKATFEKKYQNLEDKVNRIIKLKQKRYKPRPFIIVILNIDDLYIKSFKDNYKEYFNMFNKYDAELLFSQGRKKISNRKLEYILENGNDIIFDICTYSSYITKSEIIKYNSDVVYLDSNANDISFTFYNNYYKNIIDNHIYSILYNFYDKMKDNTNVEIQEDIQEIFIYALGTIAAFQSNLGKEVLLKTIKTNLKLENKKISYKNGIDLINNIINLLLKNKSYTNHTYSIGKTSEGLKSDEV